KQMNKVIRLTEMCYQMLLLLRLFCCSNKVEIRFLGVALFHADNKTLFPPYSINKTTLVAGDKATTQKKPYFHLIQ
ncbi:MAG: hypothetical protein LBB84_08475, partial [Tannerellaceae bacterium]|nr:hypothetical protein [Tannerellaceae bacterium]